MDIIIRANVERLEELMSRKTVEEVLIKTGWAAEFEARGKAYGEAQGEARGKAYGEAQGEARGKAQSIKQILELLRSGKSVEELTRIYEEQLNALSD
jgi:hypothetical protein